MLPLFNQLIMKISLVYHSLIILAVSFLAIACQAEAPKEQQQQTTTASSSVDIDGLKKVDIDNSTIHWKGHKILGYHSGTINIMDGQISFEQGDIKTGSFTIDMKSVAVTELMDDDDEEEEEEEEEEGEEGEPHDDRLDLAHHLMDEDFFNAEKYSTATFVITAAQRKGHQYKITGDMTIKGVTNAITFDATFVDEKLIANIAIDRTQFGIRYGSGSFFSNLGDNAIKDKFDLIVSLTMKQS